MDAAAHYEVGSLSSLEEYVKVHPSARKKRERTPVLIPSTLVETVYGMTCRFADATYEPRAPEGSESRARGLLLFLVDGFDAGVLAEDEEPAFDTSGEYFLTQSPYNAGIEAYLTGERSLEYLLEDIATSPRAHDLAIVVHSDGRVLATHANVEGVRKAFVRDAVEAEGGNARHTAAAYGTLMNPYWVAITVSATDGQARVWQAGKVVSRYSPEKHERKDEDLLIGSEKSCRVLRFSQNETLQ